MLAPSTMHHCVDCRYSDLTRRCGILVDLDKSGNRMEPFEERFAERNDFTIT